MEDFRGVRPGGTNVCDKSEGLTTSGWDGSADWNGRASAPEGNRRPWDALVSAPTVSSMAQESLARPRDGTLPSLHSCPWGYRLKRHIANSSFVKAET